MCKVILVHISVHRSSQDSDDGASTDMDQHVDSQSTDPKPSHSATTTSQQLSAVISVTKSYSSRRVVKGHGRPVRSVRDPGHV